MCPRCNSGFIEELDRAGHDSDSDDSSTDAEMEPFNYDPWDIIAAPPNLPGGGVGGAAASSPSSSSAAGGGAGGPSSSGPGPRRSQRLRQINQRRRRCVYKCIFISYGNIVSFVKVEGGYLCIYVHVYMHLYFHIIFVRTIIYVLQLFILTANAHWFALIQVHDK